MSSEFNVVGKSVYRSDALEKVTGKATYTTDMKLPGMLYAKILRSTHPHARIISIDTTAAEKLPGVKAVLTYLNTPATKFNSTATHTQTIPPYEAVKDQRLFDSIVRYVGDEVAAVAAESEDIAMKALKLIKVEYEILPAVFDPFVAIQPDSPDIHPNCQEKNMIGGPIKIGMGDIDKGFAESDYIVEDTYTFPVQKQGQLETQSAVAAITGDGKVTVWSPTQTPHPTKRILSDIFGLPMHKIHVLNPPYIGGAFGVRIGLSTKAEPIAVALALATGRPVKVVYSRQEDFIASETRHAGKISVKLGLKKDGEFKAVQIRAVMNGGAYCFWSGDVSGAIGSRAMTIYHIPNSDYEGYSVYTNTTPAGACRGFGAPQPTFAMEMTVDKAAAELGIDPVKLRLKNIIQPGDPWVAAFPCLSTGLDQCLLKGAEKINWDKREEYAKENAFSSRVKRGIGVAVGNHISSAFPFQTDYSGTYILVQPDGTVQVASGVTEMGTGIKTTLGQIAAEALGVKYEDVIVTLGDTDLSPYDVGGQASRSCYTSGLTTIKAAKDVKEQILAYASEKLEIAKEKLDIVNSIITDGANIKVPLAEITQDADYHNVQFMSLAKNKSPNALSWHAHFALVEVDTWTGKVEVLKLVTAHDMGRAINPQIVEGVIEGGAVMGLGYSLSEEIRYDENGRQLHDSYHKYMLPTALDAAEIEPIIVEANEPSGPYGARGVGENSVASVAPAVMSAVFQATGLRVTELPLTPERLLKGLQTIKG
ncbi:MAG: xanthine dehydrogenase family protein molybdopterin-binding subunit [Zhaonellaceae bacterium]|jgi:xanthine dehydrogenase molybdenum-binding subunit